MSLLGPASKPQRRYTRSVVGWMTLYVVLVFGVPMLLEWRHITGPALYVLAVLPSLPIGGVVWAALRLMAESDEFVRALLAKRFVIAAGITFFLSAAWGFLESYAHAPHVPMWMVFPGFWAAFGLVSPFVRTTA